MKESAFPSEALLTTIYLLPLTYYYLYMFLKYCGIEQICNKIGTLNCLLHLLGNQNYICKM